MEDLSPFILLVILGAALALRFYLRSPSVIGARGEARVSACLGAYLNPEEYTVLDDLTLPSGDGTTQVDHIVVSPFGLFVIETKNMKGWIFGEADQARWTQTLRGHKSRFQNPIWQNHKHVKTVRELLSLKPDEVHNIVVFTGTAEPKAGRPLNVLWRVEQLPDRIRANRQPIFSSDQVAGFVERLRTTALEDSRATRRTHIRNLDAQVAAKAKNSPKCPKCGGPMVERRNRKTGDIFLGCSRFPKCKGTRAGHPTRSDPPSP